MPKALKGFGRGRQRSLRRRKFWQSLGRITLKLLLLAPYFTKLVDLVLAIMRWLRQ